MRLELAACRRVGDASCPYDGVRPPNVIERATQLGSELGPAVVVVVGYNDYEANYAGNIEQALSVFAKAGVQRVLWLTLRESRQSYASMNDMIRDAARRHPELTVVDWNAASRSNPPWFQPDDIHLTAAGAEAMASLVNGALVQLGIAPKPTPPPVRRLLAIASRALPTGHPGRRYDGAAEGDGGHDAVPLDARRRVAAARPSPGDDRTRHRCSGAQGNVHRARAGGGSLGHGADAGLLAADRVAAAASGWWRAAVRRHATATST